MLHLFSKIFALFLTVAVLFSSSTVFAADATKAAPQPSPAKTSILPQSADFNTVTTQIEKIRKSLAKPSVSKEKIEEYTSYLTRTEAAIMENRREMEKQVKSLQKQIDALGEGGETEDAFITKQREDLIQKLAAQDRVLKEADLMIVQIEDLTVHILNVRNQKIYGELITKHSAFINPLVFFNGIKAYVVYFWDVTKSPVEWYQNLPQEQRSYALFSIVVMFIILMLAVGLAIFLRRLILRNWGYKEDIAEPSFNRKVVAAIAVAVARGLISMFLVGGCILWMVSTKIFENSLLEKILMTTAYITMLAIVETTVSRVTFAPHYPQWRLVNIASEKAARFTRMIFTFILLNAMATIQLLVAQYAEYPIDAIHFAMIIACAVKAIFLMWFAKIAFDTYKSETVDENGENEENEDRGLKMIIFSHIFCSGAFLLSLIGYPELSLFIFNHIILSLILCGLFEVLRRSFIDILRKLILSGPWAKGFHHYKKTAEKVDFWLRAIINPTMILVLIFVLLTFWGLPGDFMLAALKKLLFGFKIGGIQISLIAIMLGIGVFFGSLALMRIIKNKLATNVLAKIDMDDGIRHSLISGFSFIGFIMAALLAIISVGIDLTSLAFIAGALSVGIGFGLQDVIKNLVAGIIILFERPFRVGDWVVLGGVEGKIQQINIRSTELLSFDKTSVIIPNATLISSTVTNKTHDDNMSRQSVTVGVAYGSDVEKVSKILLECAAEHKLVMKNPAPYVLFKDFGASSLDFELRFYVKDINSGWTAPSDLRYMINKRFIEEGIEIPFPQVVVHNGDANTEKTIPIGENV
jgi:small-conductance mechanosensitive channel